MPNAIQLANQYLPYVEEQYNLLSLTADLDTEDGFIRETADPKTILVAKVALSGFRNYDRASGFKQGTAGVEWIPYSYDIDRGLTVTVDNMDNVESLGVLYGTLLNKMNTDNAIPETDAIRFARYFQGAGLKFSGTIAENNILRAINNVYTAMSNKKVPTRNRKLKICNTMYNMIINSTELSRTFNAKDGNGNVSTAAMSYNEMPITVIPDDDFKTDIELLDDEVVGGYQPGSEAKQIYFMIIHKDAVLQRKKLNKDRVFAPDLATALATGATGVTEGADAWKFQHRLYHMANVVQEKANGIGVYTEDVGGSSITATFSPANSATNVAIDVTPTITFSEAVKAAGGGVIGAARAAEAITLVKTSDSTAVAFAAAVNADKTVITITPAADLANNTQYTLTLLGEKLQDAEGDLIPEKSVKFTTVAAG